MFFLQVFSPAEEKALMNYLIKSSKLCYGLSRKCMRRMALEFARKVKIAIPDSWNEQEMAGRDWYEGFMSRHSN